MYKLLLLAVLTLTSVGGFVSVAHAASFPLLDSNFHLVPDAHDLDPLCMPGAPLSFGAVMEIVQRFVNMGITLGIFFFVVIMAWAGLLFIMSATNPESRSKAKGMLLNAAVGLLIVLSAWLMVDFVMKILYSGPEGTEGAFGPWNSILGSGPACVVGRATIPLFSGVIDTTDLPTTPDDTSGDPTGTFDGSFTYQANIEAQKVDLSEPMAAVLRCMVTKVPRGVGNISSISDNKITTGTKTFAQCATGGCAHTANSCHYGGRSCIGKSYAVDFGDEQNKAVLIRAATACGAKTLDEGNHVHVSIGDASGCGCNL